MILLYVLLAGAAIWYYFSTYSRLKGKPIPGLPLVGKGFELSTENLHLKLSEYADKYGDIVKCSAFNKTFVRSAFNDDPYKMYMNDRFESYWGKNVLYNSEGIGAYLHLNDGVHSAMRKGYTKALHVYGDGIKDFEDRVGRELRRLEKTIDQNGGKYFEFLNGEDLDDNDPDVNMFWQLDAVSEKMIHPTTDTIMQTFPFVVRLPGFYKQLHNESMDAKNRILRRYYHKVRILTNTWYLHHNEAIWEIPGTFVLPRSHPLRKHWLTFGTGRRQCIGKQFGRSRVFLYAASILKRYKLTATPGKCGTCDPRTGDFDISTNVRPKPFYCRAEKRC